MRHIPVARALASLCLMLLGTSRDIAAQTSDELFDASTVQDVFISINERDLAELRDRYRENVFFPADVVIRARPAIKRAFGHPVESGGIDPARPGVFLAEGKAHPLCLADKREASRGVKKGG